VERHRRFRKQAYFGLPGLWAMDAVVVIAGNGYMNVRLDRGYYATSVLAARRR